MSLDDSRELLRLVRSGFKVSPYRVQVALETLIALQEQEPS